jgi:hypothetical protein
MPMPLVVDPQKAMDIMPTTMDTIREPKR